MKRLVLLLGLLALVPCTARAQRFQVFGGYSYFRFDPGAGPKGNLNGWEFSGTYKTNRWVGLTADFSGHYGSSFGPSTSLHTYLFGPQISLPLPFFSLYVHALAGAAHIHNGVLASAPEPGVLVLTGDASDTTFAAALGGGLDTKIAPLVSFRVVQVDYLATRFGGSTQNHLRVSTGLVIRF